MGTRSRQAPEDALQFGRTNKVRQAAYIASDILGNLKRNAACDDVPKVITIDADLPFTVDAQTQEKERADIIEKLSLTAEYDDVWGLYIAITESRDDIIGTGKTSLDAVNDLILKLGDME